MVSFLLGYVGLVRLFLHLGLCGWLLDLVDRFGFFVVGVMVWRFDFLVVVLWCSIWGFLCLWFCIYSLLLVILVVCVV